MPFDAKTTPVDVEEMSTFAEIFRRHPGVLVSDHAAARFGALGPARQALLEPTPLQDYYGFGSVQERFTEAFGTVLRLGADVNTLTLTHYAEYRAQLSDKRRAQLRYVRADIGEWIEGLDDTDGIRDWPHGDYFPRSGSTSWQQATHARARSAAPSPSSSTRSHSFTSPRPG